MEGKGEEGRTKNHDSNGFTTMIKEKNRHLEDRIDQEYKKLKAILQKNHPDCQALLFVSALPGEGCSSVALRVAKEMSGDGNRKVVLIDADLRNPCLHHFLCIPQEGGLTDIMKDTTLSKARKLFQGAYPSDSPEQNDLDKLKREAEKDFEYCVEGKINKTEFRNLLLIPSGMIQSEETLFLENENIEMLIKSLKKKYDYILVDSAPANLYSDSLRIAPHVDGVVLVVEADKTRREIVSHIKEELENVGSRIIGVILNKQKYCIPDSIYRWI